MGGGFEDGGVALVGGDDAVELFEVVGFGDGDAEFFDFDGARVVNHVADSFRFAVIAAETGLNVDRQRKFVHHVTGGKLDFKIIGVAARPIKFDGILAGFLGFKNAAGVGADNARPDKQEIAGGLAIALSDERPVVAKEQGVLLLVDDGGLGNL